MGYTKEKKVKLFLDVNGKCEYCGCDMVLCFANKYNADNLATFDHLYNRDHELRQTENNEREKRIFLVCKKCNCKRSTSEPNNQQKNGVEKTVNKIVPKGKWTDEKFIERITKVVSEEADISRGISKIDKEIRHLKHEKNVLELKLSKHVKYRNLIIKNLSDRNTTVEPIESF